MALLGRKKKETSVEAAMNSAQDRLNRMMEENQNVINLLRVQRPTESSDEKERQTMLTLCTGIQSTLEDMPFVSDDMTGIDNELIQLFQCMRDTVRDGFYAPADWALRGIAKGLSDFRQDVSVVQQYSAAGDTAEKKAKILRSRKDKLRDYVELVKHYEECSRQEQQLGIDLKNYQKNCNEYDQLYEEYMQLINDDAGRRGRTLLMKDKMAHLKDPDAKMVNDKMTAMGHAMSLCKFTKAALASKQEAYNATVDMTGQLRANLMQDPMLKDTLAEQRAFFKRTGEKFVETQMSFWEEVYAAIGDVDSMEKMIDALLYSESVMNVFKAREKKIARAVAEKEEEQKLREEADKISQEEKLRAEEKQKEQNPAEKEKMRERLRVSG